MFAILILVTLLLFGLYALMAWVGGSLAAVLGAFGLFIFFLVLNDILAGIRIRQTGQHTLLGAPGRVMSRSLHTADLND